MTDEQPTPPPLDLRPESVCRRCDGHNPVWVAPSDLWNRVMGGYLHGIVCPACFAVLTEERLAAADPDRPVIVVWWFSVEDEASEVARLRADLAAARAALEQVKHTLLMWNRSALDGTDIGDEDTPSVRWIIDCALGDQP